MMLMAINGADVAMLKPADRFTAQAVAMRSSSGAASTGATPINVQHAGQHQHGAQSWPRPHSCAWAACSLRRSTEEHDPVDFYKAGHGQGSDECQIRARQTRQRWQQSIRPRRHVEQAKVDQDLRHETIQGGRPQIATAPIRKQLAVIGMRLDRPPITSISRVPTP